MPYAQRDYNEVMGSSGMTIAQIGCFLTAFCDLLERDGKPTDPPTLNAAFGAMGLDDSSENWDWITKYDPLITVKESANNGAVPQDGSSVIVRLQADNKFGTHFCLIDHFQNGQVYILDSWDGVVKPASIYGPITGWASYNKGDDMVTLTQQQVLDAYHAYEIKGDLPNGDPSQAQLDYYSPTDGTKKDAAVMYNDFVIYEHDRRKEQQTIITSLQDQLTKAGGTIDPKLQAEIDNINSNTTATQGIVQRILDKILSIFK